MSLHKIDLCSAMFLVNCKDVPDHMIESNDAINDYLEKSWLKETVYKSLLAQSDG
jgi:hypothetical protein